MRRHCVLQKRACHATIKPRTAFTSGASNQAIAAGISYQQGLVQFQFNLDFNFFLQKCFLAFCFWFCRLMVRVGQALGRDDFQFFWNFITAVQILPCVIETRRYGYIRDSGGRVETPHGATIGCEKSYNGCFHCCGHF